MKAKTRTMVLRAVRAEGESKTTRVIASTATPDRYADIVDQGSWLLDNFKANPVIMWGHDYSLPPVGRAVGVEVIDGALVADIEWDAGPHNPLAVTVAEQFRSGFLSAVSGAFVGEDDKPVSGGSSVADQELHRLARG